MLQCRVAGKHTHVRTRQRHDSLSQVNKEEGAGVTLCMRNPGNTFSCYDLCVCDYTAMQSCVWRHL